MALDAGLDTTTAAGEMVAAALAMAARFEWRRISECQVDKYEALRREGRPRAGVTVPREVADRIIAMRASGLSARHRRQARGRGRADRARWRRWYAETVRSAIETREREIAAQKLWTPPSRTVVHR